MAKSPAPPPEPAATQEEATRERPTDAFGREVDEWGLPFSGPARLRALAGRTDPRADPAGWTETIAPPLEIEEVPVPEPIDDAPDAPAPDPTPAPTAPAPTES